MIVPVLNRYDLLQRMLSSIDYPIDNLLIIDNGGQADSLSFPEHVDNVYFLQMPGNLGVAASWNLGIKLFPHHDRWFFASNDMFYGAGALEMLSEARTDEITLSDMFPYWHTFAIGEEVVNKIGLFDEALYPAFFEDNDYQRRAIHRNIGIRSISIPTGHDNSSTINSDPSLMGKNIKTFAYNHSYFESKCASLDFSQGGWSLERRREAAWDKPR